MIDHMNASLIIYLDPFMKVNNLFDKMNLFFVAIKIVLNQKPRIYDFIEADQHLVKQKQLLSTKTL